MLDKNSQDYKQARIDYVEECTRNMSEKEYYDFLDELEAMESLIEISEELAQEQRYLELENSEY